MRRFAAYLSAILVGVVVWFFFQHFRIEGTEALRVVSKNEQQVGEANAEELELDGSDPLEEVSLTSEVESRTEAVRTNTSKITSTKNVEYTPKKAPNTIRVASFHLNSFGKQVANPDLTMNAVARVVRMFDVIALQGVNRGGESSVSDLAAKAGSKYAYLVDATSRDADSSIFAFVYNTETIVADRGDGLYHLGDPDNLLLRDPLIGWFRAKQTPDDSAFTFSLVNVDTDRRHALQELNALDDAFHQVRQDWREEDDVIMLGCFERPETKLQELGRIRGLVPTVRGVPTSLRGGRQTENLLFRRQETDEFTGRGGVFNFLRAYNLSLNQAVQVSEYLPVWAEFSIFESGNL